MWNSLSYSGKSKVIVTGGIVLLVFLWFFVFKNTYILIFENIELHERIKSAETASRELDSYNLRLKQLEYKLDHYVIDSVKNREFILQIVSSFCNENGIVLKEFPQLMVQQNEGFEIETNIIRAEGSFFPLLDLLYHIEKTKKVGRPVSVFFLKSFDYKRKKEILDLVVYLQNFRKNDN